MPIKSSFETAAFKRPFNLGKKKVERMASIGEYDQSAYTIESNLNKVRMKLAGKQYYIIVNVINSNIQKQTDKKKRKVIDVSKLNEGNLGPGSYNISGEFVNNSFGNAFISKVIYIYYFRMKDLRVI